MDTGFAKRNHLPVQRKLDPNLVEAADGHLLPLGPVVSETEPLQVVIQDHQETRQFKLIDSSYFPIMPGILWFSLHNSSISWRAQEAWFKSDYCLHQCLV